MIGSTAEARLPDGQEVLVQILHPGRSLPFGSSTDAGCPLVRQMIQLPNMRVEEAIAFVYPGLDVTVVGELSQNTADRSKEVAVAQDALARRAQVIE